jgi:hypothetical protein
VRPWVQSHHLRKKKKGKENKNEKASKLLPFLSAGWEEQKA